MILDEKTLHEDGHQMIDLLKCTRNARGSTITILSFLTLKYKNTKKESTKHHEL
jgi:hypothetical protein